MRESYLLIRVFREADESRVYHKVHTSKGWNILCGYTKISLTQRKFVIYFIRETQLTQLRKCFTEYSKKLSTAKCLHGYERCMRRLLLRYV